LLSSNFEKSFIQPFIRYNSHFLTLSSTEDLPWSMDYLLLSGNTMLSEKERVQGQYYCLCMLLLNQSGKMRVQDVISTNWKYIYGEWGWQQLENFSSLVQDKLCGLEYLWHVYALISFISSREKRNTGSVLKLILASFEGRKKKARKLIKYARCKWKCFTTLATLLIFALLLVLETKQCGWRFWVFQEESE